MLHFCHNKLVNTVVLLKAMNDFPDVLTSAADKDVDMGPFSATQSNPTRHFFNPTQSNPRLRLAVLTHSPVGLILTACRPAL